MNPLVPAKSVIPEPARLESGFHGFDFRGSEKAADNLHQAPRSEPSRAEPVPVKPDSAPRKHSVAGVNCRGASFNSAHSQNSRPYPALLPGLIAGGGPPRGKLFSGRPVFSRSGSVYPGNTPAMKRAF